MCIRDSPHRARAPRAPCEPVRGRRRGGRLVMDGNGAFPPRSHCPRCGAALEALSSGEIEECPGCLFSAGLGEEGTVLGGYRLLGPLGEGGTAVVHLARNLATSELVALK